MRENPQGATESQAQALAVSRRPHAQIFGKVKDWQLVPLPWLCGPGVGGTYHVMLEDSLDHGGEHFDDHHGPGPLSAVLGRQEEMVSAEPGRVQPGPVEALTAVCGSGQ